MRAEDDMSDQDAASELDRVLMSGLNHRRDLLLRILSNCEQVLLVPELGPCRIWQGSHSGTGRGGEYGRFSFEGCTAAVHRTVFAIVFGPIPPRKQVDHKCCQRLCCEPSHLQKTTHKQNQKLRDKRKL